VSIRWEGPDTPTDQAELDLWCRAVGPPDSYRPSRSRPGDTVAEEVAFVAWNTNVGRADLGALTRALRAGELTGTPETHFVLLLQEAFRAGDPVPATVADGARSADRIGGERPDRHVGDIRRFARAEGLHLFYAPSMRNGPPGHPDAVIPAPEDRGNAILSTLPLSELLVVELPVERQRRVVVAATIQGIRTDGSPWRLRVASIHLDHVSSWRRFHRSFGAGRAEHARILVEAFAEEPHMVLGGDLNTWLRGGEEEAALILRAHFPGPSDPPDAPTLDAPLFPLNRLVDHLFFRLGDEWIGDYTVAIDRYGSDHRPLVGRIRASQPRRNVPAAEIPDSTLGVGRWAASLPVDPGVSRELERYRGEGQRALPEEYRVGLALHLRARIAAEAEARTREFLSGRCDPFVRVSIGPDRAGLPPELEDRGSLESRFVEDLARLESVACFTVEGMSAEEALRLYTSPDFRTSTESRIEEIREEENLSCVATRGVPVLLAPSRACNRVTWLIRGAMASEHSQVVSNGEDPGLQPVYFKESLKTFVEIPGGLAFHYVNYTRSADMGAISRRLGRRAARDAEERRIREFRQRLPASGAEARDPVTPPGA
jgi:endonuclease/exonuclease/phosphatase family metal-dependent hydrolase